MAQGGRSRRMGETEVSNTGGNSFFFLIKCTHHAPCISPISFLLSYKAMGWDIWDGTPWNNGMGMDTNRWDAMGLKWKGWMGAKDSFVLIG